MDLPATAWLGMADGNVPCGSWLLGGTAWENLGRCLEWFSPPTAWEFLPEEACNPAEMTDHLKEGCPVSAEKRERLLGLCWDLADAYQACVQQPQRSWRVPGSEGVQTDTVAKPETQCRHLPLKVECPLEDDLVDYRGKGTTLSVT